MKEKISLRGTVRIEGFNEQGERVYFNHADNLIVMLGRKNLALLLATGDNTRRITTVKFGTSDTPATSTDTTITGAFSKTIAGATYPADNKVTFLFSLGPSENNGMLIKEMGLFTQAGEMFARFLNAPFTKATGVTYNGTWTITF